MKRDPELETRVEQLYPSPGSFISEGGKARVDLAKDRDGVVI